MIPSMATNSNPVSAGGAATPPNRRWPGGHHLARSTLVTSRAVTTARLATHVVHIHLRLIDGDALGRVLKRSAKHLIRTTSGCPQREPNAIRDTPDRRGLEASGVVNLSQNGIPNWLQPDSPKQQEHRDSIPSEVPGWLTGWSRFSHRLDKKAGLLESHDVILQRIGPTSKGHLQPVTFDLVLNPPVGEVVVSDNVRSPGVSSTKRPTSARGSSTATHSGPSTTCRSTRWARLLAFSNRCPGRSTRGSVTTTV